MRRCRVSAPSITTRALLVAVAVAAVLAALAGLPSRATYGARTSGDEPYYLLTATSLLRDGDLDISDELATRAYTPFHEIPVDPQTTPLGPEGRRLSPHDPLLSVLMAPAMAAGRHGWIVAKAILALIAGLTAATTARLAIRRFDVDGRVAALVVGGLFAGVPLAPYGTQVYPEMTAALLVVVAVDRLTVPGHRRSPRDAVAVVAVVIALPWLSVKYLPVAVVLTLLAARALWRSDFRRTLLGCGIVLAVAGAAYLAVHQQVYGGWTVYAAGDHFAETGELSVVGTSPDYWGRGRRLVGLLVDRAFGVGVWSPGWLTAPAALAVVAVTGLRHRWALILPAAAGWVTASFVALTMHGWWVPGRQIVVVLPLVAVMIAVTVDRLAALRPLLAVAAVAAVSNWLWLAVEASVGRRALIVDFFQTAAPAYRVLAPLMPDGMAGTVADDVRTALWTVAFVTSAVWAGRAARHGGVSGEAGISRDAPAETASRT